MIAGGERYRQAAPADIDIDALVTAEMVFAAAIHGSRNFDLDPFAYRSPPLGSLWTTERTFFAGSHLSAFTAVTSDPEFRRRSRPGSASHLVPQTR